MRHWRAQAMLTVFMLAAGCSGDGSDGADPMISMAPNSLDFTAPANGAVPDGKGVAVTNGGDGLLGGLGVSVEYEGTQADWLSTTLSATEAPANVLVRPVHTSFMPGVYRATVNIRSTTAENSPQSVPVTYTITAGE